MHDLVAGYDLTAYQSYPRDIPQADLIAYWLHRRTVRGFSGDIRLLAYDIACP